MGKQLQITGTERSDIPQEILEAGEKWLDLRKEKRRTAEKAKESKYALIALMQARKIEVFRYKDGETGEMKSLSVDLEPKISVRKVATDEQVDAFNRETTSDSVMASPGVHPGLIAQAEAAQAEANVTESGDGDVEVPDTAAPKSKGKSKKKGGK